MRHEYPSGRPSESAHGASLEQCTWGQRTCLQCIFAQSGESRRCTHDQRDGVERICLLEEMFVWFLPARRSDDFGA